MPSACAVTWDQILPLLPKDSPLRAVVAHASSGHPPDPRRTWTQDRFDVKGDTAIEQLSEITGLPHFEKTDCTKGKSALMVSPEIHLSCGLAWAADGDTQMGFISGTPRAVKPTVKVNSRALIVRGRR